MFKEQESAFVLNLPNKIFFGSNVLFLEFLLAR